MHKFYLIHNGFFTANAQNDKTASARYFNPM